MLEYRIAILSNFTFDSILRHIDQALKKIDSRAQYYIAPFNQYAQEILAQDSPLYRFGPEVIVLALEGERLFGNILHFSYNAGRNEREKNISSTLSQIEAFFKALSQRCAATVLCHNFISPLRPPLGILDTKQELGVKEVYQRLNQGLWELSRRYPAVFIFDIESLSAGFGKKNTREEKLHYLAAMDLSEDFLAEVAEEYLRYLKPLKGLAKKCLVLDLDNVLWGGIIGEDGPGGIKLGQAPPGNIYLSFQQAVLDLHNRGVILCINSKNNFADAMEAFRKHPDMILKEEHFACLKINWNDKAANLKEISKELNLTTDSFVFIDDSPFERALIKRAMPEVAVVDLPEDPALFKKALESLDYFEAFSLTQEDKNRGFLYAQDRKRREFKGSFKSLDEFLKGLKIRCCVKPADEILLSRAAQLIQRTNQFNLTTPRYNETQLRNFLQDEKALFLTLSLNDIFGDNGMVGVAVAANVRDRWELDTFLLSCRILGRKAEHAFMAGLIGRLKEKGAAQIFATFIPSKKNAAAEHFLADFGFEPVEAGSGGPGRWHFDFRKKIDFPEWIELTDG
jgi:FkbH-like protein